MSSPPTTAALAVAARRSIRNATASLRLKSSAARPDADSQAASSLSPSGSPFAFGVPAAGPIGTPQLQGLAVGDSAAPTGASIKALAAASVADTSSGSPFVFGASATTTTGTPVVRSITGGASTAAAGVPTQAALVTAAAGNVPSVFGAPTAGQPVSAPQILGIAATDTSISALAAVSAATSSLSSPFVFGAPATVPTGELEVGSTAAMASTAAADTSVRAAPIASASADTPSFVFNASAPGVPTSTQQTQSTTVSSSAAGADGSFPFVFGVPAATPSGTAVVQRVAVAGGDAVNGAPTEAAIGAGAAPDSSTFDFGAPAAEPAGAPQVQRTSTVTNVAVVEAQAEVSATAHTATRSPFVFGAPAAATSDALISKYVAVVGAAPAQQAEASVMQAKPLAVSGAAGLLSAIDAPPGTMAEPTLTNASASAAADSPFVFGAPAAATMPTLVNPDVAVASLAQTLQAGTSVAHVKPTVIDDFAGSLDTDDVPLAEKADFLLAKASDGSYGEGDMNFAKPQALALVDPLTIQSAKPYVMSADGDALTDSDTAVGDSSVMADFSIEDSLKMEAWAVRATVQPTDFAVRGNALDSQVQNLVQAMASFAPSAAGQTTLVAKPAQLDAALAASWQ